MVFHTAFLLYFLIIGLCKSVRQVFLTVVTHLAIFYHSLSITFLKTQLKSLIKTVNLYSPFLKIISESIWLDKNLYFFHYFLGLYINVISVNNEFTIRKDSPPLLCPTSYGTLISCYQALKNKSQLSHFMLFFK